MESEFREKNLRSLAKAVTFRLFVIIADGTIAYLLTRRIDIAIGFILLSNLSSTILYFLHERMWNKIHWGKLELKG